MRNICVAAACAVVVLATAGCGGSSGNGGSGGSGNLYAGTYVGTEVDTLYTTGAVEDAVVSIVVSPAGQITGREINTSLNASTVLSGSMGNGGNAAIKDSAGSGLGQLSLTDSLLSGYLVNGAKTTINVVAVSTVGGTAGSFSGSFSGPYTDTDGTSGTISLVTTPNGSVTALVQNTTTNTSFIATGTISPAGALSLSGNGLTLNGTVALSTGGQLTGALATNNAQTVSITLTSP